ncbi:MAG: hypothetical protein Q7T04_08170 [Dehalococcoidia bacterium]|nr:hypothetical protein [Dehalococcoidia bacterium]
MGKSLREYASALGYWGLIVIAPIILDMIGVYQLAAGNQFTHVPPWIWFQVAFIFLLIIPFIAFHRVRVERDKARVKEVPLDAIIQELKSKIIYRMAYSNNVFSMLEIFDALRDSFALGLTYPQVHDILRTKLDRDAVWGNYSSDILATFTTMGLIHSPSIDPSYSVFLDHQRTIPNYVYQLTDIGKSLAHKLMSQKPEIDKGGSQKQ